MAMAENNPESRQNRQRQEVKEITDRLEAGVKDLFQSERYQNWLNTMSHFHSYSLNNTLLIAMQKPDATLVAGYAAWQKHFGRQVQKGEKAISIIAPAPYKVKVERDKIDPDTMEPLMDIHGNIQKETVEITKPSFRVVKVFDISQTEGRELPSVGVSELTGNVQEYETFLTALQRSCPVPIRFENIESGAKGYYHNGERRISVQQNMSQMQTVKTLIHEMAHQKLHAIDPGTSVRERPRQTMNSREVEAESVAYTVCQHYGIDTSDYSFAYIAGWSDGKETPELKASLNTIRRTASEMITAIDIHIKEIQQEHQEHPERNETVQEQENEHRNPPEASTKENRRGSTDVQMDTSRKFFITEEAPSPKGKGSLLENLHAKQALVSDAADPVKGSKAHQREVLE